jgi:hypothetical protein
MIRLFGGLLGHTRRGGMHERDADDAPGVWGGDGDIRVQEKPASAHSAARDDDGMLLRCRISLSARSLEN